MRYIPNRMNPFSGKSALIRNQKNVMTPQFERLTLNFLPASTRIEMLEDREHTVIPMVMLTEGVHNGSTGALLYTAEEMQKTPEVWNHKPIVVYHPELNGQGISACDPAVVNSRKVGVMMNTSWDAKGKRLKSEAWIEKPRAEKIDNRIFEAVDKKEMMEISTGLFSDLEQAPGEVNGVDYIGIVRNIRPDHLALLPDKIGACSIAKGAGLLRNEISKGKMPGAELLKRITAFLGMTDNEMSFESTRGLIQTALNTKLNISDSSTNWVWVEAVYSNFFVYRKDGKLFRLGYEASDTGVTLSDEKPVEVVQQVEYRTVQGAKFIGNQDHLKEDNDTMNKKVQMIAAILAANCGWTDQKALEALSEKQVESIHNGFTKSAPTNNDAAEKKNLVDSIIVNNSYGWGEGDRLALMMFDNEKLAKLKITAPANAPAPVANEKVAPATAPVTLETWLGAAPAEIAGVVRGLLRNETTEKAELIEKIIANKATPFKKDELMTLSIGNLRGIASISAIPAAAPEFKLYQPNYAGMAPASSTVQNDAPAEEPVLPTPVLNFSKETKAANA